jgi:hypothetical protein
MIATTVAVVPDRFAEAITSVAIGIATATTRIVPTIVRTIILIIILKTNHDTSDCCAVL